MGDFKRSPSKVWWASESIEFREVSASPGSQDSGFSDTETSPQLKPDPSTPKTAAQRIPKDIFKELSKEGKQNRNLSSSYREKETPEKILKFGSERTPRRRLENIQEVSRSEPAVRKNRFVKTGRSLFGKESHQHAEGDDCSGTQLDTSSLGSQESLNQSAPVEASKYQLSPASNSAPAILQPHEYEEGITSFNSLSSDCESELECLFNGPLDSPKHTSTPKGPTGATMRPSQKVALNLFLKYQHERVPPILLDEGKENGALKDWMDRTRWWYEQECMTTLQSKSIALDLEEKVQKEAVKIVCRIREILEHSKCIQMEFQSLNREPKHVEPLCQSLSGNILDYLIKYYPETPPVMLNLVEELRHCSTSASLSISNKLHIHWNQIHMNIVEEEIKNIVEILEYPKSEIQLRAGVTCLTSLCLRNEELIDLFVSSEAIPILLVLTEKCEGSTVRALVLRALTSLCCNSSGVRLFEKSSGVQIVSDIIEDSTRPEPERSEAVALLAQVSAPWLEDNHRVKGLHEYSEKLVKSLTSFTGRTKCCQNLLLCAAALANISTMDGNSVKYMVQSGTVDELLQAARRRGAMVSVYLLEQIATLLANISSCEIARKHLIEIDAVEVLLSFLSQNGDREVQKRLQQKAMIALSRLCSDLEAAMSVVELGGVQKLVSICKQKEKRFDNDAVLVAALATLRKVTDLCGNGVISEQDAQELVEPKLLDSFLAYSTQNESYV